MYRLSFCVLLVGCRAPGLRIWIGGDVHRAANVGPLLSFQPVGPGIVNLEGPVASAAPGAGLRLFNAPESLPALRDAGVRVAGIVNNHAADTGSLAETRAALRPVLAAGPEITTFTEGGVTVNVSAVDLSGGAPDGERFRAWGALPGTWVATFHTDGDTYLPSPAVRAAVDAAVGAGADVVAVHGSHLVGPVERRGAVPIAWGLGNLVFSCPCTRETEALLLEVDLPSGAANVRPIAAGMDGAPATPSPDADGIYDLLEALGAPALERHGETAAF